MNIYQNFAKYFCKSNFGSVDDLTMNAEVSVQKSVFMTTKGKNCVCTILNGSQWKSI